MNNSITILKALATVLITVSHLDSAFPDSLKYFASGGALGDTLFFFCSGFTLFLGRDDGFYFWYRRRIARIYPSVIIWAIFTTLAFGRQWTLIDIITTRGLWFLNTIMVYYMLLYCIRKCLFRCLNCVFILSCVFVVLYAFIYERYNPGFGMYGDVNFIRILYFPWLLLGAIIGKRAADHARVSGAWWGWTCLTAVCLIVWGTMAILNNRGVFANVPYLMLLSAIPLMLAVHGLYNLFALDSVQRVLLPPGRGPIALLSCFTLEIYICQEIVSGFTSNLFPLNIILIFALLLISAYALKCLTNAFCQLFSSTPFSWPRVFLLRVGVEKR